MDKCPHCGRRLQISNRCYVNLESYQRDYALAETACCHRGIIIRRQVTFSHAAYDGPQTEDDWGVPLSGRKAVA